MGSAILKMLISNSYSATQKLLDTRSMLSKGLKMMWRDIQNYKCNCFSLCERYHPAYRQQNKRRIIRSIFMCSKRKENAQIWLSTSINDMGGVR